MKKKWGGKPITIFDKCWTYSSARVRSRVIDISLHSSPTLSAPTDSQYLLLSAETKVSRKELLGGGYEVG